MNKPIIYIGTSFDDLESKISFERFKNSLTQSDILYKGEMLIENEVKWALIYSLKQNIDVKI